ncbi:hypothetical protein M1N62_03990 [Thermodesulfovibrionales bacterium]|nr:hypothetical protein [Thermodesulfovibrionales bacterium]
MKIKNFIGDSFKDALETVKKELGPDAIILSSKAVKTRPPNLANKDVVEVTAAVDETGDISPATSTAIHDVEEILREIRSLKDEVVFLKETLRPVVPTLRVGKEKKGLFNILTRNGVDFQFAITLLERSQESIDSLRSVIKQDIKTQNLLSAEGNGLIFLGPSGVGKTTTMSKIAHLMTSKKNYATLMSLDEGRVGSIAHMKELSKQLRCQLKVIKRVSELPKIIYKEIGRGPILIDTPGYEYKEILEDIREIFPSRFPLKRCFLMDASMNMQSSLKAWQHCNNDMIDYIGFTKIDMAAQYGNIYNLSLLTSLPLSLITTGTDVPGDIEIPTPEFLANLITGGTYNGHR